ncbi:Metallo-dependent hydrolase [Pseudovirgaria hyperparasitica]|uniref:Metallo-dependent hydrolase n=1 Tax=Pseudovirgaria hyperparasitica TaxID=470096 RepID=A0A6A6WL55_9PEZI|nr:Metallo-dependent hydrolase [Pseudovirgaria hyperparasitica]KAF2762729.1 Metallo-dependent hydrolase [Pseudovirgaria hyperparasitica]
MPASLMSQEKKTAALATLQGLRAIEPGRLRDRIQEISERLSKIEETLTDLAKKNDRKAEKELQVEQVKLAKELYEKEREQQEIGRNEDSYLGVNALNKAYEDAKWQRQRLVVEDVDHSWDYDARCSATETERKAARIIYKIREFERVVENDPAQVGSAADVTAPFGNNPTEELPSAYTRDMGGQFLTNKTRIDQMSKLYDIAKEMPKGALLHLHLNAEILPAELIRRADQLADNSMFIASKTPLLIRKDFDNAEIQVAVHPDNRDLSYRGDIFSDRHPGFAATKPENPDKSDYKGWMMWSDFREAYQKLAPEVGITISHVDWVKERMVLSEAEVYDRTQTVNGIWARFNQGTRAFKGFLNYETAFKWYIGAAIDEMVKDRIMYAELRPMWLDKVIPSDKQHGHDGKSLKLDHKDQIKIIIEEARKKIDEFPYGIKIIYCTPRSIPKSMMWKEVDNCLQLKAEYPDLICGFDLVGAEDRVFHVGRYIEHLAYMQEACRKMGPDFSIPFMFHAGETLMDRGGSFDPSNSNLYDAVSFRSKRIGHGFALPRHTPRFIERFKQADICIELCPISNELLHLCRNAKEHPFPQLLQAGIPCTLNSDNPSLFSNSLSYEFYQVMVGWTRMNLHGWKQLALWSLKYSCLNESQKQDAVRKFDVKWQGFCDMIVKKYENNWDQTKLPSKYISHNSTKLIEQLRIDENIPYELQPASYVSKSIG